MFAELRVTENLTAKLQGILVLFTLVAPLQETTILGALQIVVIKLTTTFLKIAFSF